jgi:hypothetical protein
LRKSAIASAQPSAATLNPSSVPSPPYRFTLEQYEAMEVSGVLGKRARVHFINGEFQARPDGAGCD